MKVPRYAGRNLRLLAGLPGRTIVGLDRRMSLTPDEPLRLEIGELRILLDGGDALLLDVDEGLQNLLVWNWADLPPRTVQRTAYDLMDDPKSKEVAGTLVGSTILGVRRISRQQEFGGGWMTGVALRTEQGEVYVGSYLHHELICFIALVLPDEVDGSVQLHALDAPDLHGPAGVVP